MKVIIVASAPWPGDRLLLDYEFPDSEENLLVEGNSYFKKCFLRKFSCQR